MFANELIAQLQFVCLLSSIGVECSEQVLSLQQLALRFLLVSQKGGIETGWGREESRTFTVHR